ncbi:MAG: ferritin [Clostridiales bacterium]|nr:ferritin [Clostridiales bacterium]
MISAKLEQAINKQINAELYSAYLYLSMSAYYESIDLPGFANWMKVQFEEEQFHALKFFTYLADRGGRIKLEAIDKPVFEWKDSLDVFKETLTHEQHVTSLLNALADVADEEKDRPTQNLLKWFLDEQVEEEASAEKIIKQLKMIDGKGQGLLMLDRELATRVFVPPTTA